MESFEQLLLTIPDTRERLSSLFRYLLASEAQLMRQINAVNSGAQLPAPSAEEEGDLEFGLILYWLRHPDEQHVDAVLANPAFSFATQALVNFAPQSSITEDMLSFLSGIDYNTGFVAADGTLYTPGKYAQLDLRWFFAAVNYVINLLDPDSIYQPFPMAPYHTTIPTEKKSITIAILGDWGTGPYDDEYAGQGPAVAVMNAIRNLKPDYVVHLGDVYYCGTDARHPVHEELDNFLTQWNTGTDAKTCFTLNSNHEMYGAAQGLIGIALNHGTPFEHQNRTTYFGLEFGAWVILGLDSAYFDPSILYMKGALGDAGNTQQRDFISKTFGNLKDKKVFLMTHHNAIKYDGSATTPMWDSMLTTLGGNQPYAWYWGHLHLGAAYNAIPGSTTLGRCVGHSAIPFGNPSGLNSTIAGYYAHTPLNIGTRQMQNGFATVTLGADGSYSEAFYEVDAQGRYSKPWSNP